VKGRESLESPDAPSRSADHKTAPSRGPTASDFIVAGVAGATVTGLLIGRLTLGMNAHLYLGPRDPILLLVYFAVAYGALGLLFGLLAAAVGGLIRRTNAPRAVTTAIDAGLLSALLLGPLLYYALLPDVGFMKGLLSGLIFGGGSRLHALATLAALAAMLFGLGQMGRPLVQGLARATRSSGGALLRSVTIVLAVLVILVTLLVHPPAEAKIAVGPDKAEEPVARTPGSEPTPLVLLCIDGCDLDDMVLPMAERGELPAFSRLMKEGTWGPLQTIIPTLSAVVWTTLITGKTPEQHGIRHFIVFRLPGITKAIHQFPRHTGLNFRIFPLIEKIPGCPPLQAPYTSNMREAEALWGIVGRTWPVGAWRWLVTWPVEPVNGFNVAGGVGWIQIMGEFEHQVGHALEQGFRYPRDLYDGLPEPPHVEDVTADMLEPYVGKGQIIPTGDWRVKAIAAGFHDPTGHYLPKLMRKYRARFTAASFYSVDEFCHYFAVYRNRGGIFSDAVAERYRYTDARLGEFLNEMGDSVNVIVVSDHGYNFRQNHHTDAPAGVFFARGPAFAAGRHVEKMNVYDVAPLCLYLLDLPLPEDMPGTGTAGYRAALPESLLALRPPARRTTYETGRRQNIDPVESPIDEQIKEQLRSLGYIN
jgi:hypothetical protein